MLKTLCHIIIYTSHLGCNKVNTAVATFRGQKLPKIEGVTYLEGCLISYIGNVHSN